MEKRLNKSTLSTARFRGVKSLLRDGRHILNPPIMRESRKIRGMKNARHGAAIRCSLIRMTADVLILRAISVTVRLT